MLWVYMSLQHNAAQYDTGLPACALPPPLMCLHFHPMAVSRWFSAASLKQVSNMAITGSGSLAISLSLLVILAAFLRKGKFFMASFCVCVSLMQNRLFRGRGRKEKAHGKAAAGRSCGAFARWMRTSFHSNLSITFILLWFQNIHTVCWDCWLFTWWF